MQGCHGQEAWDWVAVSCTSMLRGIGQVPYSSKLLDHEMKVCELSVNIICESMSCSLKKTWVTSIRFIWLQPKETDQLPCEKWNSSECYCADHRSLETVEQPGQKKSGERWPVKKEVPSRFQVGNKEQSLQGANVCLFTCCFFL